jgi:hypothetical protein
VKSRLLLLLSAYLFWTINGAAAFAQTSDDISIRASVPGGSVMLGTPIILRFEVENLGERAIDLYTDRIGTEPATTYTLFTQEGMAVRLRPDYDPPPLILGGTRIASPIKPGEKVAREVVVSPWLTPPLPGNYLIWIDLKLPWYELSDVKAGSTRNHGTFQRSLRVPATFTVPNTLVLRRMAAEVTPQLAAKTLKAEQAHHLLDLLFSIPDGAASAVWREVATNPRRFGVWSDEAIRYLFRLGSKEAVAILAEVWASPESEQRGMSARGALASLYHHGDPALKEHIGRLFVAKEGKTPPWAPKIRVYAID